MKFTKETDYPVLLLLITIILLWGLSFIPEGAAIFGIKIKAVDIFSDIKPDSLLSSNFKIGMNSSSSSLGILLPITFSKAFPGEDLGGNTAQMKYFFDALRQAKNKKVRILHYGDSVIEGDLITSDFRNDLQKRFGGEGIGMTSITSEGIRFRVTVKHTFSNDWKTFSVYGGKGKTTPGINGTVSIPSEGSWIKLESSGIPGTFKTIKKVYIFYSDAKSSSLKYSLANKLEKLVKLQPGSGIKQIVIDGENSASIKITAAMNEQACFYGISIESDEGIIVDNFPLRGNSGVSIREIPEQTMKEFNDLLDYKLIILQFGLNMVTSGQNDYRWYEQEMSKVINNLKVVFPETSFLLVSVGDKSIKKGTRFVTDPNVKKLVAAQQNIAENTGIAFWNLYESMGGENSMNGWVNAKPPLAMKDFTHFNNEGAKKIGKMLFDVIMKSYK